MWDWLKSRATKTREKRAKLIELLREKGFEVFEYIRSAEEEALRNQLVGELVTSGTDVGVAKSTDLDKELYVFLEEKPVGCIKVRAYDKKFVFEFYWWRLSAEHKAVIIDVDTDIARSIATGCSVEVIQCPTIHLPVPKFLREPQGTLAKY